MKLTLMEHGVIVDSRLVDLEDSITTFKDNSAIKDDNSNIFALKNIVKNAEALLEAYEAKVEAEENMTAEMVENEYKIQFGGEE